MRKGILMIALLLIFTQCSEYDCKRNQKEDIENECIIILEKGFQSSFGNAYLKPEGKNPKTGEYCKCSDPGRWWGMYRNQMEKGDTFIKNRGDDFFTIHKKDTILRVEWGKCDESGRYIIPKNNPPQG